LFEATKITGQALVRNLIGLLNACGLKNKIITYVKDEVSNLNTLTNALKSVVKCETLGLEESFQGTCFGHVFSKVCQYATTNDNVCKNLIYVSIKISRVDLQKCITWPKKSNKGHQKWNIACIKVGLRSKKLNIPVKTRLV
jgi:hypothetical protein